MKKYRKPGLLLVSTGLLAIATWAAAQSDDQGEEIYSCVNRFTGVLRVDDDCRLFETPLVFNTVGPPGPAGEVGPEGPAGPPADLESIGTYQIQSTLNEDTLPGEVRSFSSEECDEGDLAISAGWSADGLSVQSLIRLSDSENFLLVFENLTSRLSRQILVVTLCLDFPPTHVELTGE